MAVLERSVTVQGDAGGLKMDVDRVLRKLEVSSSAAEQSVSLLRQIDLAKSRMEEACSVLKVTCLHGCPAHSPSSGISPLHL